MAIRPTTSSTVSNASRDCRGRRKGSVSQDGKSRPFSVSDGNVLCLSVVFKGRWVWRQGAGRKIRGVVTPNDSDKDSRVIRIRRVSICAHFLDGNTICICGSRLIVNNRILYGSIDYNTIKPRGYLVALCVRNGTSNGRIMWGRTRSAEVPRRWVHWRGRHHSQSVSSGGKKTA